MNDSSKAMNMSIFLKAVRNFMQPYVAETNLPVTLMLVITFPNSLNFSLFLLLPSHDFLTEFTFVLFLLFYVELLSFDCFI